VANESLRHTPFVFEEQNTSEFRKSVRAILERSEDCFPVGNGERDRAALVVIGVFQVCGSVVKPLRAEALRKLKHEPVRDGGGPANCTSSRFYAPSAPLATVRTEGYGGRRA
jgi:hypothetical protein